jgi:hypothetical protein
MHLLPMLIVGGVAVPLANLPEWALHASAFLPGRYAVAAIQSSAAGPGIRASTFDVAALIVIGAAGCVAGAKLFRWDEHERFADRSDRAWVAAALAAWIAVGSAAELRNRAAVTTAAATAEAPRTTAPLSSTAPTGVNHPTDRERTVNGPDRRADGQTAACAFVGRPSRIVEVTERDILSRISGSTGCRPTTDRDADRTSRRDARSGDRRSRRAPATPCLWPPARRRSRACPQCPAWRHARCKCRSNAVGRLGEQRRPGIVIKILLDRGAPFDGDIGPRRSSHVAGCRRRRIRWTSSAPMASAARSTADTIDGLTYCRGECCLWNCRVGCLGGSSAGFTV